MRAYEVRNNPDAAVSYGFRDLPPGCQANLPPSVPGDLYSGLVDSHAYSVGRLGDGWVVGDAAGNDLLGVSPTGSVRTVAVLPAQPVVLTAQTAGRLGLDPCVVGSTYAAEPVPTDVQHGPDGMLYVSLLAGDPAPARSTRWTRGPVRAASWSAVSWGPSTWRSPRTERLRRGAVRRLHLQDRRRCGRPVRRRPPSGRSTSPKNGCRRHDCPSITSDSRVGGAGWSREASTTGTCNGWRDIRLASSFITSSGGGSCAHCPAGWAPSSRNACRL